MLLQELTSSQASSTTQALSCRSRPLPVPLSVSGGLHYGGLLCHSHLEAEGLRNFLGQFCEAPECILVQRSTDWTISTLYAHLADAWTLIDAPQLA